ncbi:OmpA family protein [Lysobacter capsici]|jgi:hypothetical protein|uniref:OmpA family protein n=1 Tax=Lysobacter capsici TaxID=435897 RepID=UPI000BBB517D|nr:OmpA family protein [Lysobacter capsici]ATE73981.1 hypothetical protein CNO08_23040 [Lysobacter capsici]
MNSSVEIKCRSVAALLFLMAVCSCASSSQADLAVKADNRGYFADPGDFWGVNFKPGQPTFSGSLLSALSDPRDESALENDLMILERMPSEVSLRVVGFTDSKECSGTSCVQLSLRRAQALHDWLLSHGVSKSRLSAPYGFGSARPIGDNETEDGRARNRRAYISYEDIP